MSKRRTKGEGGIYQRSSDGRWVGVLELRSGGRRRRKYVYGRTRPVVARKLLAERARLASGLVATDGRLTVNGWLDRWERQIQSLAPNTITSYTQIARDYLRPEIGRVRLAELGPAHIQQMLDNLAERRPPVSPPTIAYSLTVLRIALKAAQRADLMRRENPARLVTAPRYRRRKAKPFSAREAAAFMASVKQDRLYPLIVLALTAALRRGELLGLTWAGVDLPDRSLHITQQLQRRKGGGLVTRPVKTERSEAPVALTQLAVRALQAHRSRLSEERLMAGGAWQGSNDPIAEAAFVFVSETGTPMDPDNLYRRFHKLLENANLPERGLHANRHTTASLLGALGVSPAVAADVLRHSKVTTTLNVYTHAGLEQQREAAAKLDELLGDVLA